VIDKALIVKLLLLLAVTASIILIYLAISPYQNCKRDLVDSFEKAYENSFTWSERSSLINQCANSTKW
tara:strand:+ start:424 stop:627 length:204 start_codon:yes stop_codon:yes gene_type:complete